MRSGKPEPMNAKFAMDRGSWVYEAPDDTAQEFTSTAVFGTSMSAHHILGLEQVPRVRLFAD